MHIIHCVASVNDKASGLYLCGPRIAQVTSQLGADVELCSVGNAHHELVGTFSRRQFDWDYQSIPGARRLMFSHSLRKFLKASKTDVFHNHGLWLMPNVYAGSAALSKGRPLVLSPHGMLAPAAFYISGLRKKVFAYALEKQMFKPASIVHATSEQEMHDIRALGLKQPVTVIPNGVDIPDITVIKVSGAKQTLRYFGRPHPIKILEFLIRIWKEVEHRFPEWSLSICGPGEPSCVRDLKHHVQSMRIDPVKFLDPVDGDAKHE